ncbi:hypothetical protein HID58_012366 [Brassica napus]|uniref:(rape) hypothetical protein n=1 Tax=Brassica napus TaxID=3708 RepID=A0A816W8W6_BRANA|nr:hypothetical protein HID58_012366 [Brassica napus]CAF2130397.1 unnamed protein product [Brassica napus]
MSSLTYDPKLTQDCLRFISTKPLTRLASPSDYTTRKRKLEKAFTFMDEMAKRGLKPNNHTYSILIRGMFDLNKVEEVIQLFLETERAEEGQKLFDEMMSKNAQPNSVVYNHLIRAYCRSGRLSMAFHLSEDMKIKGISPSCATYTSLIKGLSVVSLVEEAKLLLEEMKEEGLEPNVFHYTALIDGYAFKESIVTSKH